jgi:gluconolactonase
MKVRICCVSLLAILVLGVTGIAREKVAKEKPAKRAAARDKSVVAAGAEVRKLAGDFKFTEGPAGDTEGNVYFSDIPNNRILKWSRDGQLSTFLENSGGANGLYFDKAGNLLACQGEARKLVSISPKGEITVLADRCNSRKFNSPNDLWIDPKGGVYFTDPRYGNRDGMEQTGEHVYYLAPDHKTVVRVISDMVRPNGLIGTPNGQKLYVTDNGAGKTYVYTINRNGMLTHKQLFVSEGADGMSLDSLGNVYLATKTVAVYNPKGRKVTDIEVLEPPSNVTFGGKDNSTLFITARTSFYAVDMQVKSTPTVLRTDEPKATKSKTARNRKSNRPAPRFNWRLSPSL